MKVKALTKRLEKGAAIDELREHLVGSEFCFILNYGGLTVSAFAALRGELRETGAIAKVVKNSFFRQAAEAADWGITSELLEGPTALVTGQGDPAEVAKLIVRFLKKNETATVKGARLGESSLDAEQVVVLSELPSKDSMRSMLLGTLLAPATSLVRVFAAPLTGVLYVLKAKAEKDGGDESAA